MVCRRTRDRNMKSAVDINALVSEKTTHLDECMNKCAACNCEQQANTSFDESQVYCAVCCWNSLIEITTGRNLFSWSNPAICDGAAWINQSLTERNDSIEMKSGFCSSRVSPKRIVCLDCRIGHDGRLNSRFRRIWGEAEGACHIKPGCGTDWV